MKKVNSILALIVLCSITCCTSRQSKKTNTEEVAQEGVFVIDVEKAVASATKVYHLSDIAERIEYIPLEFRPECAIGQVAQVYITQDDIFILTMGGGSNDLFRFDKNGKFMNIIGARGNGPGEYILTLYFAVDTTNRQILVSNNYKPEIIVFNYEGRYLRTIKKDYTHSGHIYFLQETNELVHLGIPIEFASPASFFVSITDTDNNRILHKKYLVSSMISSDQRAYGGNYTSFQTGNRVLLNDGMSDTIFVYSQKNLNPYFILNYGKYKIKLDAMLSLPNNKEALHNYMYTDIVAETSQFLYLCFYQGNGKKYYLLRYDKYSQEYATFKVKKEEGSPAELFYNDIDGGLSVLLRAIPKYNQLARIVDAFDMKETLTSEFFSKSEAKDTQAKERLKKLVHSLGDEDNPIIMKISLK